MSINALCKSSVMAIRGPRENWEKLQKCYKPVFEVAIDAKLTKLQQIVMGAQEAVMEYSNRIDSLVNEMSSAGHTVWELEKQGRFSEDFVTTLVLLRK